MPNDSDPIMVNKKVPDDLCAVILDIISHVQFKFLGMMLMIFLFINSDVFINRALSKFKGAVDFKCPTSWGVILQGLFLVIIMIGIDAFIRQKII